MFIKDTDKKAIHKDSGEKYLQYKEFLYKYGKKYT